jgi:hypothetical protein
MPDIAMCRGDDCPRKRECYRHRAVPTMRRQSIMPPPVRADGSCDSFLELRKGDVLTEIWQEDA